MTLKTFTALCKALGDQNLPENERWKSIRYINIAGQAGPGFDFQTMLKRNAIFFVKNNDGGPMFIFIDAPHSDMGVTNINDPVLSFIPLSVVDSVTFCVTKKNSDGSIPELSELTSGINNDGSMNEEPVIPDDLAKIDEDNTFNGNQTINGSLHISGDIIQHGETYITHAEEVHTKKDIIITRDEAISGLLDNEYTGILAKKYNGVSNGMLVFDNTGTARVGDENDLQPLLTRDEENNINDGEVFKWDAENQKAVGVNPDEISNKTKIVAGTGNTCELIHNTEFRYDEITAITITIPNNIPDDYISSVVFTTDDENDTNFTCNGVYFKGTDCRSGSFIPKRSKRYIIIVWSDGNNVRGLVDGCEVS